jgi:sodium-dependent dicarboxylate transporter 2/3/5
LGENKTVMLIIGPIAAMLIYWLCISLAQLSHESAATAGVTIWCLLWWISEPIPIPVTSMLPMGLLPLLGVLDGLQVAQAYGSPLILLLLGGFILSKAMEYSGAHYRVAMFMVSLFGASSGKRLVFGFMAAAAGLSMWISNTATTLMLLPVAMAVLAKARDDRLAVPLLLGIAYAASVGGIGTPIGTPPNLIFMQVYKDHTGSEIGFFTWMSWALPVVIMLVPVMAWWLSRHLGDHPGVDLPREKGSWTAAQKRVMWVFALTALAWMTRKDPFGGWSTWFNSPNANDAAVAFMAVIALFTIPNGKGGRLLDWESAVKIPWGVLLLFAGGITIAKAFQYSGLSSDMAMLMSGVSALPVLVMIAAIALAVTFLTEATSNTASTSLLMPLLAATAMAANIEPVLLMVPAAMSASCAFMLPVATAPNSVVYGSGMVTTKLMAREGFALNLCGAFIITIVCYLSLT